MNPTDLLNTNRFMTRQAQTRRELEGMTNNRIPNRTAPNKVQQFIRDGAYQDSMINQAKQQIQQWPPSNSKVTQPVLSREISDLVENRYSKFRSSYVSIDNRDGTDPTSSATVTNGYQIFLNKKFENVVSIELVNIMITNPSSDNYFFMLLSYPELKKSGGHSLIKGGTLFTDSEKMFAKIIFKSDSATSSTGVTTTTERHSEFVQNIEQYYNEPIDRLDQLLIKFVDRNGTELDFGENNHTLTLKIVEKIDLLKETMYDTRRGRPVSVGMGQLGGVGHI